MSMNYKYYFIIYIKTLMNFYQINFNAINIKKYFIKYGKRNLIIKSPEMMCIEPVTKNYNKYTIKFHLDSKNQEHQDFKNFIQNLDIQLQEHLPKDSYYKSCILYDGETLVLKVPYRYNKFETKVESENYLKTLNDIKQGDHLKCDIHFKSIWKFEVKKNEKTYLNTGALIEVKTLYT